MSFSLYNEVSTIEGKKTSENSWGVERYAMASEKPKVETAMKQISDK